MNILLVGSGGREHALAWKLVQSPRVKTVFANTKNPGIQAVSTHLDFDVTDRQGTANLCRKAGIDLVVVGPEAPLVDGLTDVLTAAGIPVFGPDAYGAQLEGSKAFTKTICDQKAIPTAAYATFDQADAAHSYVDSVGAPCVVKADGLAAGKGVVVAATVEHAHAALDMMFDGAFGDAGTTVVIEECLIGEEASAFFISDGETVLPFGTAQDHKRAYDGDEGPNTGGMGAYSPAPILTPDLEKEVLNTIARPAVRAMADAGHPYKGVLYAGLMMTKDGPKLIEFNCRFGDPECQVLMMRYQGDLASLLLAAAQGNLASLPAEEASHWSTDSAMTVVMASKGYPGSYEKGTEIRDVDPSGETEDGVIFHAGTEVRNGALLATGGRVLNVSAQAHHLSDARDKAYGMIDQINWPGGFFRKDIGWRAI